MLSALSKIYYAAVLISRITSLACRYICPSPAENKQEIWANAHETRESL